VIADRYTWEDRGCTNAGPLTCRHISHLTSLTHLNLSATSLDLDFLTTITKSCINLQVLKIADCKKMSANTQRAHWEKWLDSISEGTEKTLGKLKRLKLRHSVSFFSGGLIGLCHEFEKLSHRPYLSFPTHLNGHSSTNY
jgi:hypothetical protein